MTYLIDSDWVIDWLAEREQAIQLLSIIGERGVAISLVTYGEVYEGIYYGRDPIASERMFQLFLHGTDALPLNHAIMRRFARIRGQLRRQGRIIGDPDILIGATALHHDLSLVTRNISHFERIPGLRLHWSG